MRYQALGCLLLMCGVAACSTLQPTNAPTPAPGQRPAPAPGSATGEEGAAMQAGAGEEGTGLPLPDRVVEIVAERFLFTPSEITVEQGTTLEIRLTSEDTDHGFRIAGPSEIDVEVPKRGRGEARVIFVATEPGEYRFECSRICGAGHNYMRGVIRVTPAAASSPHDERPANPRNRR